MDTIHYILYYHILSNNYYSDRNSYQEEIPCILYFNCILFDVKNLMQLIPLL